MSKIRFKKLFCLGFIGEDRLFRSRDCIYNIPEEVEEYFFQKYKNRFGHVLFFNLAGGLVIKPLRELTADEMKYFGII